jgi:DNA-binding MarR family transcriptional regulator
MPVPPSARDIVRAPSGLCDGDWLGDDGGDGGDGGDDDDGDEPCRVLADDLLAAMAMVRRTTRRLSGRPLLLSVLTASQAELVRTIARRPGVSVTEAAEELRLAPNTVSTLVGQLTDAGVVLRRADRSDRRVVRLELEHETRKTVTDWRDRRSEAVAVAVGRLTPRDRRRLTDALPVLSRLAGMVDDRPVPGAGR